MGIVFLERSFILSTLLLASLLCFRASEVHANDEPFLTYDADSSWSEERFCLDNLARFLWRNPNFIGYIGYYSSQKLSEKKLTKRIQRAVKYLIEERRVNPKKLQTRYLGTQEIAKIILQPVVETYPEPWSGPAEYILPPVEIVVTSGSLIGEKYTEDNRFRLKLNADHTIADILMEIRRIYPKGDFEEHHGPYFYLQNPETGLILDPKKTIHDYKLADGVVLRLFSSMR